MKYAPPLFKLRERSSLELELNAHANRGRELEDQSLSKVLVRKLNTLGSRDSAIDSERLVLRDGTLCVGYVEPVKLETQLTIFTKMNRIVGTEVEVIGGRRAVAAGHRVDGCTAWIFEALVVAIDGVRRQGIERPAGLCAE